MAFTGRLHPLMIHLPIALVIAGWHLAVAPEMEVSPLLEWIVARSSRHFI